METFNLFRNIYRWWKERKTGALLEEVPEVFRFKYACFRDLLDSNAQLLSIIADLDEKLRGHEIFGMSFVRSQATRAAFHTFRMIKSLDVLAGHRYGPLYQVLEQINRHIKEELERRKEIALEELVLPYAGITKEMMDWVGGKSANLGEVLNRVGLPIPRGFAITTRAYVSLLAHNDLVDEISKRKMELDVKDPESVIRVSEEIRQLILAAEIPPALTAAISQAYEELAAITEHPDPHVSMRSSAIGEDSELSFAGQYATLLNVTRGKILEAYLNIVASLFTPRAISYRLNKGIRSEDIAMSVACLEMVDSVASGVMYSRHPFHILEENVVITAVWGLGLSAVDGTITPDIYEVAKDPARTILKSLVARKPTQLVSAATEGLRELEVPLEFQDQPCLTPEQIRTLAEYAIKLEKHYQGPQDIEWALDREGRLLVLQTRPLRLETMAADAASRIPRLEGYPLLLEGGACAFPGVGCGPAFLVRADEDLLVFPEGAVLVARHSSPKFVLAMPRAQAIVAESGSVAGHMAAVAREFKIPTLLDVKGATTVIPQGQEVTLDAYSGRVYQGRVPELLALQRPREAHMEDTPVYQTLKRVADWITPLNLVDPKAPNFGPEGCKSLHDLGRLVHELSYTEMFKISDVVSERGGGALKLEAPIPLDLYLIDLGGGLRGASPTSKKVLPDQVASAPFLALLKGLLHEDLRYLEPRPIQFSGLFSVMREQMLSTPQKEERFGEKSYAIISDKYLNFSSRVGYHYSVLDAYLGQTLNKNYITFSFKGGAADETRRNRRVRAIALVLMNLDFTVDVKGDRVDARLQKYAGTVIADKLEMIGRLLLFTRQMDMLMTSEVSVEAVAQSFMAGDYRLENRRLAPAS